MEINPLLRLGFIARSCLCRRKSKVLLLQCSARTLTATSQATSPVPPSPAPQSSNSSSLGSLGAALRPIQYSSSITSIPGYRAQVGKASTPPHHLHVFSTKHNTHITLTRPDRNPIFAVSTGNLGFRKAARGTYDAAYQLGAYMMNRIQQQGLLKEIYEVELVLRGFGDGREAIKKILLGSEGMGLRPRIVRVTDATRLKFGGTRSKKPRRLG
ncbi:hypothetical protein MMC19_005310 [Ptychographa xylographoides]|nr:hypothetical protein [Ptychographa xylographoides]